jgi:hypothetical protein
LHGRIHKFTRTRTVRTPSTRVLTSPSPARYHRPGCTCICAYDNYTCRKVSYPFSYCAMAGLGMKSIFVQFASGLGLGGGGLPWAMGSQQTRTPISPQKLARPSSRDALRRALKGRREAPMVVAKPPRALGRAALSGPVHSIQHHRAILPIQ